MLKEFREFAIKGNMLDLAIGIIIGAAFGTVIKSLVDNILMPIISGIFQAPDFSNLFWVLRRPAEAAGLRFTSLQEARDAGAAVFAYGQFINDVIAFLIVAFAAFLIVKAFNQLRRRVEKEQVAAPVEPPKEQVLLEEIRDLLAARAA